jgi:hypothetical protein
MLPISFKRHRFPPDVIRQAVWRYFRFTLSIRCAATGAADVPAGSPPARSQTRWGNGLIKTPNLRWVVVPQNDGVIISGVRIWACAKHHRGTTMKHFAGIDVSLELSSVCVVDGDGRIQREAKVLSEPDALIAWFAEHGAPLERIGLEAGPLSQRLFATMVKAGLAVELLETRHVRDAFKAMPVKTDKKDARGIAQLMRLGWFRPVHCKTLPAQEVRAVLTARKLLKGKLIDLEMCLRGILRGFGLKVGPTTIRTFEPRVRALVLGHPTLELISQALLKARAIS